MIANQLLKTEIIRKIILTAQFKNKCFSLTIFDQSFGLNEKQSISDSINRIIFLVCFEINPT